MKFIWISITMILGLVMFVYVKQHFIWALPYMFVHLSIITLLKHKGLLELRVPKLLLPMLFILLQLLYSFYMFHEIDQMGYDEENYDKEFKFNLIRIALLFVEYPLMLEFFKRPKFNRY